MERWAEAERLSEGRLQLLIRLRFVAEGGVSLGELARAMWVTPRTVTGLVDNLERDGLVERVPEPHDRRSILARLTSEGKERIDSLWRPAMDREGRLVEGFSHEQLLELRHLCLRLVENMQARNAAGAAPRRD
ncbi:MAG: MarR family winged helix-turn-helix transcriptional regulator, partial [Candidatus Dormibacterales bacterium]